MTNDTDTERMESSRPEEHTTEDWLVCPSCGCEDVECRYANADDGTTLFQCTRCSEGLELL